MRSVPSKATYRVVLHAITDCRCHGKSAAGFCCPHRAHTCADGSSIASLRHLFARAPLPQPTMVCHGCTPASYSLTLCKGHITMGCAAPWTKSGPEDAMHARKTSTRKDAEQGSTQLIVHAGEKGQRGRPAAGSPLSPCWPRAAPAQVLSVQSARRWPRSCTPCSSCPGRRCAPPCAGTRPLRAGPHSLVRLSS
jgi:hypothetical protein